MTTTALARAGNRQPTRKERVAIQRASGYVARRASLPDYLEMPEINALIQVAPHAQARLLMLVQWRAGLRISEALALDGDRLTLKVRQGKGGKDRVVPVHSELGAGLRSFLAFGNVKRGSIFDASRSTAWRWLKQALARAVELGAIPPGRKVGTHTLRHSAARHWLASGFPINVVSRWLGHASLQTTLVYLEILPDPAGFMERVP
jgi:integrase/recombinase XerD